MAKERIKSKEISIVQSKGSFLIFKVPGASKQRYSLKEVSELRQILSKEKAKILNTIKTQDPSSIYDLSKKIERNFKSVSEDVKLLAKFGIVELKQEQTKNRKRLKPVIATDILKIQINI